MDWSWRPRSQSARPIAQCAAGSRSSTIRLCPAASKARSISGCALRPALEGVLEMREGQAGIGAREGRIEPHRHLEEMPRLLVVRLVEPIHVPQAAMMRLPRVQRVRRLQDGAVALAGLDLVGDRRDDPVADLVEHEERVVELVIEDFGPDDPRGPRLGQFDRHGKALALAPHRSADDVVDVQHPAGLFRTDAPLVQREHGALRDDEQASQLGEPGDHVVGERVGSRRRGHRSRWTGRRTASPRWRRGEVRR